MYVCITTTGSNHTYLLVVAHELASLVGDLVKDIHDERVHDGHALGGDTRVRVHLLQHLVDVDGVRLCNSARTKKRISSSFNLCMDSPHRFLSTYSCVLGDLESSNLAVAPTRWQESDKNNKKMVQDKVVCARSRKRGASELVHAFPACATSS
jgi:hypothetical protein